MTIEHPAGPPETDNPYSAPEFDSIGGDSRRLSFPDLSFKEVKKLKNHSASITTLAVLWIIGFLVSLGYAAALMIGGVERADGDAFILALVIAVVVVLSIFQLVTAIGCFRRTSWSRVCGMIVCVLMLINIPVGTALGILGLIAFAQSGALFGPDRYSPRELKQEFAHRKRHRID